MKKAKILIIEEDRFLIKLYGDELYRGGFEIIKAITAEEGLHKVSIEEPDLIILDLVLPQKSGFEVLKEIKLNPKTKDIPVIIITNLDQETDIKRGLELGAVIYLVKSELSVNQLLEIVKEQLVKSKKKIKN